MAVRGFAATIFLDGLKRNLAGALKIKIRHAGEFPVKPLVPIRTRQHGSSDADGFDDRQQVWRTETHQVIEILEVIVLRVLDNPGPEFSTPFEISRGLARKVRL